MGQPETCQSMEPITKETSASPRPGGVAQVHNLLDRLELRLQLSQWLNLGLAGALVLSAGTHGWRALHPPQPEYFATTADGRLIPLVPISEPYVAQEICWPGSPKRSPRPIPWTTCTTASN